MTSSRDQFHLCYVLHRRDYRNTSLLLELFSQELGRIPAIAKGAKSSRSPIKGLLQPFRPISVKFLGRGEIKTLTGVESAGNDHGLSATRLYCGFYVNELLMRLLERQDPHQRLFSIYAETLHRLNSEDIEQTLRRFELLLLQELGYGLVLDVEVETGECLDPNARYHYLPESGPIQEHSDIDKSKTFEGSTLLGLNQGELLDQPKKQEARRLLRMVLSHYLGEKPLKSRELFRPVKTRLIN